MKQRNAMPDNLLLSLLERLESAQNGIVYLTKDQLDKADPLGVLQTAGLIEDSQPLTHVICDGCDWRCPQPVQFRYDAHGTASAAFVMCEESQNMGRISVDLGTLEMRKFTLETMATWLARSLSTNWKPQEIEENSLFHLGAVAMGTRRHDLYLIRDINQFSMAQRLASNPAIKQSANPILITLAMPKSQPAFPFAAVSNITSFRGNNIELSTDFLTLATPSKSNGKRGAKPQHDWPAYRKEYDFLISEYGKPGIDEPDLPNQAAIEKHLTEWGEKNFTKAPAPSLLRSHVSKWLEETRR